MMTFDRITIGAILAGLTALAATALALELAGRKRRRLAARLAAQAPSTDIRATPSARTRIEALMAPLVRSAAAALFSREADRREMVRLLVAAGVGGDNALMKMAAAKALAAVVMAGIGLAVATAAAVDGVLLRIAAMAGAGLVGALAPEFALRRLARGRRDRLRDALPDAIDLMVISANAGQSLDMALDRVAREMVEFSPEMAAELQTAAAEMQALPDRSDALRNLAERTDLAEIRAFCMTLAQSVRYGSPFSDALKALGADLRAARMLAAEERGARLPAMLTLPLILFIMPAVFVVVVGPAAISMSTLFGD